MKEQHPDRKPPGEQVARNALESLVARGLAERDRQQRSVFYTAVTSPAESTDGTSMSPAPEEVAEPLAVTA